MAIQFDCPYCETSVRVPDSASGKKGKCPQCGKVVRVPTIEIPPAKTSGTTPKRPPAPEPPPVEEDEAPPKPAWMGGEEPEAESAEPDTGGFVEAPADGPPDFSAFAEEPEPEPLIRTDAPAAAPAEVPAAATATEGEFPAFGEEGPAAAPVAPAGEAAPPPGKRLVRRRKRKKGAGGVPPWAIPVACVVVLAGLYFWWNWSSRPKLAGTLDGQAFGFLRPPAKTLDAATAGMDPVDFATLANALEKQNLHINSDFMRVDVRGRNGGIEIRAVETRNTRFVKVLKASNKDLQRYLADAAEDLQEERLKRLKSAVRRFATHVNTNGMELDGDMQLLVRNDIALNVLSGTLGYHVQAVYDRRPHLCCYEDGEGVYFLLPKAAETFGVEGREIDGTASFTGDYTVPGVKVFEGEMPPDYRDPWDDSPASGPGGGADDDPPPLSELGGTSTPDE